MALQYSFALTSFLLLLTLVWVLKAWRRAKVQKLPPGPWKLPLVGNLHNLLGSPQTHHSFRELARKHGPLMHLQLGQVPAIVVSSPRIAREVMKTHDLAFSQRPEFFLPKIMFYDGADIAFSPYGDYWRQMRKACVMELLSAKRVQSFDSLREEEVHNLIQSIHSSPGSPINFSEKIFTLTSTIVSRVAFGSKRKDHAEFLALTKEFIAISGGYNQLVDLFPSYKFLHGIGGWKAKIENIHAKIDKIMQNIINEHREKQRTGKLEAEHEDFVDVLLGLQQSGKLECPITDNNIKAIILDIFSAGTDTSSSTVECAMSEMIRNPKVLEKAQAEIRQAFKGKKNINEKDLQNLST
ncbi:hypothetical protein SLA2020_451990 [Shorea laevis]